MMKITLAWKSWPTNSRMASESNCNVTWSSSLGGPPIMYLIGGRNMFICAEDHL